MGLWMNLDVVVDIDLYVGGGRVTRDIAKAFIEEFGNAEGCCTIAMEWDYIQLHVRDEDRGTIPDVYLNRIQDIIAEFEGVASYSLLWNPDWSPEKLLWKSKKLIVDEFDDDDFEDDEDDGEFEVWTQL